MTTTTTVDELVRVLLSFMALITILIVQQAYEWSWFDDSLTFIPKLQAGASGFTQWAWEFYSNLGLTLINLLPFLFTFIYVEQRTRAFYYLVIIAGIGAITAIMKLNYHQQRPIWVSEDIQAFGCSNQYGNPSGHSSSSMGVTLAILLDYNGWAISEGLKEEPSKWAKLSYRGLALVLGATFVGTIGYSRLFLGVHSLNQVVFGFSIGAWFALTMHFIFKEPMTSLVQKTIDGQDNRLANNSANAFALLLAAYAVQIANYEVVLDFQNPELWSQMITEKCGASKLQGAFQARSLSDYGEVAAIWGGFYGIIAQQKYTPGIIFGTLEVEPWWRKFARLGIAVLLLLPSVGLAALVALIGAKNSYVNLIFQTTIPTCLAMFCVFFASDIVNRRLGLLKMTRRGGEPSESEPSSRFNESNYSLNQEDPFIQEEEGDKMFQSKDISKVVPDAI